MGDIRQPEPLRIAVTGASGFVGRHLVSFLREAGHTVVRLVRRDPAPGGSEIGWRPERGVIDAARLEDLDAVVHLAGESIAGGRWSARRKQAILESRTGSTRFLAETLASRKRPPRVLVAASAVGFYGDRGTEPVEEDSPAGEGFLAEVCRQWEGAADPARAAGIRVVHLRLGMVLSSAGGALATMLPPFRFGLGGPIGSGRQMMSWIGLDDLLSVIPHLIEREELAGPVNGVSATPVSNREFTRTLGRVLGRPAILPLPGLAVRMVFGEMGRELLLQGVAVRPARLAASGFRFRHPTLEEALRHALGR